MAVAERYLLIVEDDVDLAEMIRFALVDLGLEVIITGDVDSAWQEIKARAPELVLLDWMLPDTSGLTLLRDLRRDALYRSVPVIMLTARAAEDDRVLGLDSGADDYLIKPFSVKELKARIKALLRRVTPEATEAVVTVGGLKLDPLTHKVTVADTELTLGPTEYRLLHFFMAHPGRVYSRTQLLDKVWGTHVYVEERTVDVHIRRLRKALEPASLAGLVETVRGAGYRLDDVNA